MTQNIKEKIIKIRERNSLKRKITMLLLGGLALGLSRSPRQYFEILGEMSNDIKGIRKSNLKRTIKILHGYGHLKEETNFDGTVKITLSEKGRRMAELYTLDDLRIKRPRKWDGNWRVVIFDIPEKLRKVRDAIRIHLRNLGFFELQKSVFVCPFPCIEEIDFVVKFYGARKHVRVLTANSIDNEDELMGKFKI